MYRGSVYQTSLWNGLEGCCCRVVIAHLVRVVEPVFLPVPPVSICPPSIDVPHISNHYALSAFCVVVKYGMLLSSSTVECCTELCSRAVYTTFGYNRLFVCVCSFFFLILLV